MSVYKMQDGTVVNTDKATQHWEEETYWNGNNHISKATGSQWNHQTLYRSRRGRYYIEHSSQYQGAASRVEWIDNRMAAAWLLANNHEIPEELAELAEEVEE